MNDKFSPGEIRASAIAGDLRFALVVSRFNSFITERLLAGALDALQASGAAPENIEVVRVPGSFEIPLAAKKLAESGRADALIAIGCVLRGETTWPARLREACSSRSWTPASLSFFAS